MPTIELHPSVTITQPTPMRIAVPVPQLPDGPLELRPENGGPPLPAQPDGVDCIVAIVDRLQAGSVQRFQLEAATTASPGVTLREDEGTLEIHLPEGHFTTYHFGPDVIRPYLWPLYGPGQKRITRNYPMEEVEGEEHDHPHHKSLWTAFDEVNGVNNWHDGEGHGFTRHQEFTSHDGPVFGGFIAQGVWTSREGGEFLDETRSVRVYNVGAGQRLLDYSVTLTAQKEDVTFGDTKEGGILSVRVASSMDGVRGGHIENSTGGKGEKECWGQRAAWCDYSGAVDGETLGIAVFDHPGNPNHPTRWHVRDYGLMTTNPLSNAAFVGGEKTPATLREGESWMFHYRVLLHHGGALAGRVAEAYQAFVS